MKTLIIYAHPKTTGHCPTILKEVEKTLKNRNIDYELIDLYKIKYDPVLHETEHYTTGHEKVSKQNLDFQNKIKKTNKLIFIYPVWWGSMPAIMKGFLDRVFTSGFAFKFKPAPIVGGIPIKLLKGTKAIVFLTTGTIKPLTFLIFGNRFKKLIRKDILGFFGINTKVYHIDGAMQLNEKQIKKIKKAVRKGLKHMYSR